jgi:protein involved in polysaccharide export with SLBB domain
MVNSKGTDMRNKLFLIITFQIFTCMISNAQNNLATGLSTAQAASFYYIAKPGEITMQVNVWGFVEKPGRYEIPISTDIVELLSFAGGPKQYAKLDEVKIIRMADSTGAGRRDIFVDLTEPEEMTAKNLTLRAGDTIFLDHTSWVTLRDVFTVVSTAAIVTAAVSQVIDASKR